MPRRRFSSGNPWRTIPGPAGFMVTVGDGAVCFDTLYPAIRVVPRNQYPCSLSWTSSVSLTAEGVLDLTNATKADTLNFIIRDQDDPLTEKYTVVIVQNGLRSVQVTNDRNLLIAISPNSFKVRDTLRVTITDRTNTTDGMTLVIVYKPAAYLVRALLNTPRRVRACMPTSTGFPF